MAVELCVCRFESRSELLLVGEHAMLDLLGHRYDSPLDLGQARGSTLEQARKSAERSLELSALRLASRQHLGKGLRDTHEHAGFVDELGITQRGLGHVLAS